MEATPQKTQLDLYLEYSKIYRKTNLNVLTYWKANQYRYSKVTIIAKDILSIPISSVAYESTFSVGGSGP